MPINYIDSVIFSLSFIFSSPNPQPHIHTPIPTHHHTHTHTHPQPHLHLPIPTHHHTHTPTLPPTNPPPQGVGLGGAWISPEHSIGNWADYLYQTSYVDARGREKVAEIVALSEEAIRQREWKLATRWWAQTQTVVGKVCCTSN